MSKAQFAALLASLGVGFSAGSLLNFVSGPPAQALFVHVLRIDLNDGGIPDLVTAYRTAATQADDGGVELEDVGPADCTGGNTGPLRTFARNNCRPPLVDGGVGDLVLNIRIIDARPNVNQDGKLDISVYGDTFGTCTVNKPAAVNTFIDSLTCTQKKFRSGGRPL